MNTNFDGQPYFMGIVIGLILGLIIAASLSNLDTSPSTLYFNAIKECEKTLPRNQHCKIIGVIDIEK